MFFSLIHVNAQQITPELALKRILTQDLQAEWFTDDVLAQVSLSQLSTIIGQVKGQVGEFVSASGDAPYYDVQFSQGTGTIQVVLDEADKISGLLFIEINPSVSESLAKTTIQKIFSGEITAEDFSQDFLAQVPFTQIAPVVDDAQAQLGELTSIAGDKNPFKLIFTRGTANVNINFDDSGKITGLLLNNLVAKAESLEDAVAAFADLAGEVSVVVVKNSEELAAVNADVALGVGSTFKLAVLKTLREQIDAGLHTWNDVVALKPEWKSLPSGILQNEPDGTEVSLERLATLMISISDNTATDALIDIVGRAEVEKQIERNRPFLKTREMFVLKSTGNEDLLARYLEADELVRRNVVEETSGRALPKVSNFPVEPTALEVEWFFTTRELCNLMTGVQDLALMTENSGVANPENWQRVAFKGGSEPGVLNLTTWLVNEAGDYFCISVTNNNSDVVIDENHILSLYQSLLSVLK